VSRWKFSYWHYPEQNDLILKPADNRFWCLPSKTTPDLRLKSRSACCTVQGLNTIMLIVGWDNNSRESPVNHKGIYIVATLSHWAVIKESFSKATCAQYSISWWNVWLLSYKRMKENVLVDIQNREARMRFKMTKNQLGHWVPWNFLARYKTEKQGKELCAETEEEKESNWDTGFFSRYNTEKKQKLCWDARGKTIKLRHWIPY